jgi:signal transduction histidine kinase
MARRLISPLTVVAVLVIAGASVGVWWVIRHGVQQQNQALLKNDTSQVVLILQEAIGTVGSTLSTLGTATADSGDSPTVFAQQAASLTVERTTSVALVDSASAHPSVVLAAGPDLHQGEQLTGAFATAVSHAVPTLSGSTIVHLGAKDLVLFTVVPPATPSGTVVLETSEFQPHQASPNTAGPFRQLDIALYASAKPEPDQLIASTLGARPLPEPTASAELKVGTVEWDTVGAAKAPLVGSSAEASPWIVLGVGLVLALLLGVSTELLVRRQRHTAEVVAQREAELLEAQAALVRQERLSAVGEMATVIGHELRNPLGAAVNSLFLVRHELGEDMDPKVGAHLSRAERETNRAAALSEDLTAYMRERPPSIVTLDLAAVISEVLESTPPPAGVTVSTPASGIAVVADQDQLLQVLINLVTNAYQAMPTGGSLTIAGSDAGTFTEITLQDTGPGIDPQVADRLFDPFVTTKANGTGLGLAIVKQIVEAHGGTVAIEPGPAGGARFILRIPRS